eukprot:CAMPEP_0204842030 /NCGR_PEP_ID=MMETSP1346-20131115/44363_1 /ASSEMBLY_ACC=CAM_ASM_000771 /TAXON_ID=215587 /ORGANISM="Aplanochytrium stocchinoi, Strain GSBS06" /LENGTH=560 /DNA_ID=CAMNT_0051980547 /DNA_START=506 /DNA_END=2188 /DNA_ORIENTATION=+
MDMAQALIAVHNSNRIHRDFKTANILINNQCKALLTDFGSSVASNVACSDPMDELAPTHNKRFRPSQPSGGFHKQIIDGTTLGYTAPEILCNKVATKAADIYGFAITMSEILTGIAPYAGAEKESPDCHTVLDASYSEQALIVAITKDHLRPNLVGCGEQGVPMELLSLIRKCWNSDPQARPGAEEVLENLETIATKLQVDTSLGKSRELLFSKYSNARNKPVATENTAQVESFSHSKSVCKYHIATDVAVISAFTQSDLEKAHGNVQDGTLLKYNPFLACGAFATSGRRGADKMEDRHRVLHISLKKTNNLTVCAVFDGHGGPDCSEFSNNSLPYLIRDSLYKSLSSEISNMEERQKIASDHFVSVDERFRQSNPNNKSGTTAITVALWWNTEKNKIIAQIANSGDCRAVVCRVVNSVDSAVPLSTDHCADNPYEMNRILSEGGHIIKTSDGRNRVQGHIQVTRSLGDASMKPYGVCAAPQIEEFELDPTVDEFLIVATDGVFDTLSNMEAIKAVRDTAKDPGLAAKRISGEALAQGSKDNISCIVVYLREFDAVDKIF